MRLVKQQPRSMTKLVAYSSQENCNVLTSMKWKYAASDSLQESTFDQIRNQITWRSDFLKLWVNGGRMLMQYRRWMVNMVMFWKHYTNNNHATWSDSFDIEYGPNSSSSPISHPRTVRDRLLQYRHETVRNLRYWKWRSSRNGMNSALLQVKMKQHEMFARRGEIYRWNRVAHENRLAIRARLITDYSADAHKTDN